MLILRPFPAFYACIGLLLATVGADAAWAVAPLNARATPSSPQVKQEPPVDLAEATGPYRHLGRAYPLLESNPTAALTHLHKAAAEAGPELLVVLRYYQALAHTRTGDYKSAAPLYLQIYREKVWDSQWQDKILAELFACLFYLGDYEQFSSLFSEHQRSILRSPGLEKVLFFAAQVFEKQKNYTTMFTVLEQAALLYPLTPHARYAFAKLADYACEEESTAKGRVYYFSLKVLRSIARNTAMDEGIRDFVLGMSHSKVRLGRTSSPQLLGELARVQFLFDTRLYEEAYEAGNLLYHDRSFATSEPKQHQDLLVLLGRLANRLNKHQDASLYYSQFIGAAKPGGREALQVSEYLADSLTYGGFGASAAHLYAGLARKSNKSLVRWHHFWTKYMAAPAHEALALLQGTTRSYVPPRDAAYPQGPRYWQARLLEKEQQPQAATALYRQILAEGDDDIYGNLIASRFPTLVTLPAAARTGHADRQRRTIVPQPVRLQTSETAAWESMLTGSKATPELARQLAVSLGLASAGVYDLAKMLLNRLPINAFKEDELLTLVGLAQKTEAFYFMHEVARKLITSQEKYGGSWQASVDHQQRFASLWQRYYPLAYGEHLQAVTDKLTVDPLLVLSVVRAESNYRETALSWVGARGLMQIMPYTAMQIASRLGDASFRLNNLWQPQVNLAYGSWYLKKLLTYYGNHPALAVAAYNAGPFAVNSWLDRCQNCRLDEFIETISFKETRRYVKDVLKHYARYHRLYEGGEAFGRLIPSQLPASRPLYADLF